MKTDEIAVCRCLFALFGNSKTNLFAGWGNVQDRVWGLCACFPILLRRCDVYVTYFNAAL